jgi:hypothetical protein
MASNRQGGGGIKISRIRKLTGIEFNDQLKKVASELEGGDV